MIQLQGKPVAATILETVSKRVAEAQAKSGRAPGLAVVLVGDDPASQIYVRQKHKAAQSMGIQSFERHLPKESSTDAVLAVLDELNRDSAVHGILVQLPLPEHIDRFRVLLGIAPAKDVDGLTQANQGALVQNRPGLRPCTPLGIMDLLDYYQVPVAGRRAVVIGRSALVGMPVALLLLQQDATLTVVHSKTPDPAAVACQADILVVAAGQPALVTRDWIKPGAAVIDVGIHRTASGLVGDVDVGQAEGWAGALTPVPGGVGPMTIAELMRNTWQAFRQQDD